MAGKKIAGNYEKYAERALLEIKLFEKLLREGTLYLCVSRCYYAAFYSMKAALDKTGIKTSSHKQTQVEFRKQFISSGKLEKKYSKVLAELFETRSKADYDINWVTNKVFVDRIVRETKDFVEALLNLTQ